MMRDGHVPSNTKFESIQESQDAPGLRNWWHLPGLLGSDRFHSNPELGHRGLEARRGLSLLRSLRERQQIKLLIKKQSAKGEVPWGVVSGLSWKRKGRSK